MCSGSAWVPVTEAASLLQVSPLTLQNMMIHKDINIGVAVKNEGSSRWRYLISPELLNKELERFGLPGRWKRNDEH